MKVLLIGSFKYSIYSPAFEKGFRQLGCEVRCIHNEEFVKYKTKVEKFFGRLRVGLGVRRYNKAIVSIAKEFMPDFVFCYSCYDIDSRTVSLLQSFGTKVFSYNNDDPFSGAYNYFFYRKFYSISKIVDHNFVYRAKNIKDYERIGAKTPTVLLPYFLTEDNYYIPIEDDIPIAFIGHFENDGRDVCIKKLMDAGLPVQVYNGSKWKQSSLLDDIKSIMKDGVKGPDYNFTLNRCRIALVFLSKINNDKYTRRCFEIPATKTLMLSEYTDELNLMFPENECAVYFRDSDDLVNKCKYLLDNPSEIDRISENGYNRVKEIGGSEIDRCRQIISFYEKNYNKITQ